MGGLKRLRVGKGVGKMASREYKGDPIDATYQHISERAERTEVPQDNSYDGKMETRLLDEEDLTKKQRAVLEVAVCNPDASCTDIHEIIEDRDDVEVSLPYIYSIVSNRYDDDDGGDNSGQSPWRNEETLRRMYIEKEMSLTDMADELGCSGATVSNWLTKYNITQPKQHDESNNAATPESRTIAADGGNINGVPLNEVKHLQDKIELVAEFTGGDEQEVAERIHKMTADLVEEYNQSQETKSCGGDTL